MSCDSSSYYETGQTNEDRNHIWVETDYLCWKIQDSSRLIPLVLQTRNISSLDGSIVLGQNKIDTGWHSGIKTALGFWFDRTMNYGIEGSYFFLPNKSKKYSVRSEGTPNSSYLLIPFFNAFLKAPDGEVIASPVLGYEGTAVLTLSNKMQGAELNLLATTPSIFCSTQFVASAGFRYWNFQEGLAFCTSSPYIPPLTIDTFATRDRFNTKNNFYGGQLGATWQHEYKSVSFSAKGKVALGAMRESLDINGYLLTNDFTDFGAVVKYPGGYFALPTNIGKYKQTKFAVIPEINVTVAYQLLDCIEIKLGYNFMYASNVLRSTQQINNTINPTQAVWFSGPGASLSGAASPKACLKTQSLWVQGLIVGTQFSF